MNIFPKWWALFPGPGPRGKHPGPVDNKKIFLRKKYNVFLFVRNIQKNKEIFSHFLVTPDGLLRAQAQIKNDLTVLPKYNGLELSKFKHVLIRV